ncbi:MAG: oligosaccharide flippase family protein [Rhodopila sp.]|jgi:O-antigen/teichoic acid export membrane protein
MALTKRSLLWVAADTGGTTVITFVTMILLARMMTPEQYGTGALVIGTVQFLNLFVGGFFHDALIQNPNTDDEIFETAISMVLVIAIGVCASCGLGAAIAAHYMLWPAATGWLFVVTSFALPFSGVVGIGSARMRRDLIFRNVAQASLVGRLFGCVAGLVLAILGFGAWSLVAQFASDIVVQTVWLFGRSGWRPRPSRRFGILWPVCRFALPYAVMHSVVAARIQGFLMMVAGFLSLGAAGYVNVAFRLTNTPQLLLATASTNLGLPLLARDQNSGPALERSFLLVSQMVLSVTIPAFVGLALAANDLVPILLGAEWISVIPLVQILAVGTAVTFMRFPASSALRALGYVRYSFASSVFQLVFTLLGIFVLRPQDLQTIVWLWVLPTFVQLPVTLFVVARVSAIRWRVIASSFLKVLIATATMSVVVLAVADAMQDQAMFARLLGEIASGAITAGTILLLSDGRSRSAIASVLRKAGAY